MKNKQKKQEKNNYDTNPHTRNRTRRSASEKSTFNLSHQLAIMI